MAGLHSFSSNRLPGGAAGVALLCLLSAGALTAPSEAGPNNAAIRIESGRQTFEPFEGRSQFEGGVKIVMEGTQITGAEAQIQTGEDGKPGQAVFSKRSTMVRTNNNMKQTVQADTLNMKLQNNAFQAKGKVVTQITGDTANGNVSIQSDSQEFDQEKHLMRAVGHVTVKKDDMTATSPEALIFMGPSGAAEKVVFIKGATMVQGEQRITGQTITVNIANGDIYAEKNAKSTVIGKNSEGKPTKILITSHLQEFDKATGTMYANGNAVVDYDDYIAKGPKATFYRKGSDLDRIVLVGRAQVEDAERKVVGDTVTITVSPRQFAAKGNVNTFIKAKSQAKASASASKKPAAGKQPVTSEKASAGAGSAASGLEQEMMIEKEMQKSEKTR